MKLNDQKFDDISRETRADVERRVRERGRGNGNRNSRGGGGRRRKRRRGIPPILIVFPASCLLLAAIVFLLVRSEILSGLLGSRTQADRAELFGIESENEAGILLNGTYYTGERARIADGEIFLSLDFVRESLNDWFYFDENEKLLLYSLPTETRQWTYDGKDLLEIEGKPYLSPSLVEQFTPLTIGLPESDPARIVLRTEFGSVNTAVTKRSVAVRTDSSLKSDVVTRLDQDVTLRILSSNSDWSQVETPDGFAGYVENRRLRDFSESEEAAPALAVDQTFPVTRYEKKVILGWHQVMSTQANSSLEGILSKGLPMNVIGPTWYSLKDTEGGFQDISGSGYVNAAHSAGLLVWAVADNFNMPGFSAAEDTYAVLSSTTKRRRLTEALVSSVKASGADGINLDFEELSAETGLHFAQFVKELAIAAHASGLTLSVDNYVPKNYSRHYHREVQGKVCDYVVIMGYDEHTSGSAEAGPVASIDFVREGIEETLLDVDKTGVINGIPFYTRIWDEQNGAVTGSQTVGMSEAAQYLKSHGVTPEWNDAAGCNYGEYTSGDTKHRVWLEDLESVRAKLSLMEVQGLAGVAVWKLGLEDPAVWNEIAAYAAGSAQ